MSEVSLQDQVALASLSYIDEVIDNTGDSKIQDAPLGWTPVDDKIYANHEDGVFVRAFKDAYGNIAITIRGTANLQNAVADLSLANNSMLDEAMFEIVKFVAKSNPTAKINLIGHSYGGHAVLNAALALKEEYDDVDDAGSLNNLTARLAVTTFNSAGVFSPEPDQLTFLNGITTNYRAVVEGADQLTTNPDYRAGDILSSLADQPGTMIEVEVLRGYLDGQADVMGLGNAIAMHKMGAFEYAALKETLESTQRIVSTTGVDGIGVDAAAKVLAFLTTTNQTGTDTVSNPEAVARMLLGLGGTLLTGQVGSIGPGGAIYSSGQYDQVILLLDWLKDNAIKANVAAGESAEDYFLLAQNSAVLYDSTHLLGLDRTLVFIGGVAVAVTETFNYFDIGFDEGALDSGTWGLKYADYDLAVNDGDTTTYDLGEERGAVAVHSDGNMFRTYANGDVVHSLPDGEATIVYKDGRTIWNYHKPIQGASDTETELRRVEYDDGRVITDYKDKTTTVEYEDGQSVLEFVRYNTSDAFSYDVSTKFIEVRFKDGTNSFDYDVRRFLGSERAAQLSFTDPKAIYFVGNGEIIVESSSGVEQLFTGVVESAYTAYSTTVDGELSVEHKFTDGSQETYLFDKGLIFVRGADGQEYVLEDSSENQDFIDERDYLSLATASLLVNDPETSLFSGLSGDVLAIAIEKHQQQMRDAQSYFISIGQYNTDTAYSSLASLAFEIGESVDVLHALNSDLITDPDAAIDAGQVIRIASYVGTIGDGQGTSLSMISGAGEFGQDNGESTGITYGYKIIEVEDNEGVLETQIIRYRVLGNEHSNEVEFVDDNGLTSLKISIDAGVVPLLVRDSTGGVSLNYQYGNANFELDYQTDGFYRKTNKTHNTVETHYNLDPVGAPDDVAEVIEFGDYGISTVILRDGTKQVIADGGLEAGSIVNESGVDIIVLDDGRRLTYMDDPTEPRVFKIELNGGGVIEKNKDGSTKVTIGTGGSYLKNVAVIEGSNDPGEMQITFKTSVDVTSNLGRQLMSTYLSSDDIDQLHYTNVKSVSQLGDGSKAVTYYSGAEQVIDPDNDYSTSYTVLSDDSVKITLRGGAETRTYLPNSDMIVVERRGETPFYVPWDDEADSILDGSDDLSAHTAVTLDQSSVSRTAQVEYAFKANEVRDNAQKVSEKISAVVEKTSSDIPDFSILLNKPENDPVSTPDHYTLAINKTSTPRWPGWDDDPVRKVCTISERLGQTSSYSPYQTSMSFSSNRYGQPLSVFDIAMTSVDLFMSLIKSLGGGGGGNGCFAGTTQVLMADQSLKSIKDIVTGDFVLSFPEEAGEHLQELTPQRVYKTISGESDGFINLNDVLVKKNHRYLMLDGSFRAAGLLELGDVLVGQDGDPVKVSSILPIDEVLPYYNIEVEGFHTFVAAGYRVHNGKYEGITVSGSSSGGGGGGGDSGSAVPPIVLDLDHSGSIDLIGIDESNAFFDVNRNGFKENVGWVSGNDGFLVFDLDGSGTINDVDELVIANHHQDAQSDLEGLKLAHDSNEDGVFDASDLDWNLAKVWQDSNENGITEEGELLSLADHGITSIGLVSDEEIQNANGNIILGHGEYITTDEFGVTTTHKLADVVLEAFNTGLNWVEDEFGNVVLTSTDGEVTIIAGENNVETINLGNNDASAGYGSVKNDAIVNSGEKDALFSGGAGNDFLFGGIGDDTVIGGAGIDQLLGGAGNDLLIADADDSILNGGTGLDTLFIKDDQGLELDLSDAQIELVYGSQGNDHFTYNGDQDIVLEGRDGSDTLRGGSGDDYLSGGDGDDILYGGEGNDIASYSGSFEDYRIISKNGTLFVEHKFGSQGPDGSDILVDIERLQFADQTINLSGENRAPITASDAFSIFGNKNLKIEASELLSNDFDPDGDQINISFVGKSVGGDVSINSGGQITFTPYEGYVGDGSFEYSISDNNGKTATGNVSVTVLNSLPTDTLFNLQWFLKATNVIPVWNDYTGKGVTVADVESGPAQTSHQDLSTYDGSIAQTYFPANTTSSNSGDHPTSVMGLIAGARNGEGIVGIAYDASVTQYKALTTYDYTLSGLGQYDVANIIGSYSNPFEHSSDYGSHLQNAISNGRDGLGTVLTVTGGNQRNYSTRSDGYLASSANFDRLVNSRYNITVAALETDETISFSSSGANILVSSPGSKLLTTDLTGSAGYNDGSQFVDDDYTWFAGTCGGTPIVSGIIALMLEANPTLGYRDVQEIIAYSSRQVDQASESWQINGATNWNGGGLRVSHDYGYGIIDALAAVRLAETWTKQSSFSNEHSISVSSSPNLSFADGETITDAISIISDLEIDQVEIDVNISTSHVGDLIIILTSPNGTKSILADRPGKDPDVADDIGTAQDNLTWTFSSTQHWGENAKGAWTLEVTDTEGQALSGVLNSWSLRTYGDVVSIDDTYIFTNEFGNFSGVADQQRRILSDGEGSDTINASAASSSAYIDLRSEATSVIADNELKLSEGTVIENVFSGDGDDFLFGNDANNIIRAGRGKDHLQGGAGADTLDGGQGVDIVDYSQAEGGVNIDLELGQGFGSDAEGDILIDVENVIGTKQSDILKGDLNDNELFGGNGDDTLLGGAGNDIIIGGHGDDELIGDEGDDLIYSGVGSDVIDGGTGIDIAAFYGDKNTYDIVYDGQNTTVTGSEGISVLSNVELLRFSDGDVDPTGLNVGPEAEDDSFDLTDGNSIEIDFASLLFNDTDANGDELSIIEVGKPQNGAVTLLDDKIIFTPDVGYTGAAGFEYIVSDNLGGTSETTVSINVNSSSIAVVSDKVIIVTPEDSPVVGQLITSENSNFSYEISQESIHGTVQIQQDGTYAFTPDAGYVGLDQFSITTKEGGETVSVNEIYVNVVGEARYGEVLQVNTEQRAGLAEWGEGVKPESTALVNGDYVVTWSRFAQDSQEFKIFAQRYTSSGYKLGEEFQVSSNEIGNKTHSTVEARVDGGFVVSWTEASGGLEKLKGRIFDADGKCKSRSNNPPQERSDYLIAAE